MSPKTLEAKKSWCQGFTRRNHLTIRRFAGVLSLSVQWKVSGVSRTEAMRVAERMRPSTRKRLSPDSASGNDYIIEDENNVTDGSDFALGTTSSSTSDKQEETWVRYAKALVCTHAGKYKSRGKGKSARQEYRSTEWYNLQCRVLSGTVGGD
ncbi:uncharacterized protein PITG_06683 [Phytophthora infestans T30-4]|uniref:Uncharacterized protein n=1 Tax=Phytophthora infestans (strain T30-4) TaxID=403677 RepID=D0N5F7_PHYIT|nr:uncharacterized protein PITG_06683 [Phytophthora infestans T30-4]EEY70115.1 conserved hypothetical protein [Phytophthora infestans T30-4]|eukprot:XP_002998762.1 conserved hypothetical protein [Phytophthora infestans T30-4]